MIGKTISHYKIVEKLGEGGMGVVYKAEDTRLKRTVALKFLSPQLVRDEEDHERFVREAQAAAAIDHPNVCTIHEIGEADGEVFIAMSFCDGVSLKENIESGPVEIAEAVDIGIQIAQGLGVAHGKGIIHRDIKSANVMVLSDGQVKVMDFGLAKLPGQTQLTSTGTTPGTTAYMSPEQARGDPIDHRSDLWSVGVVLYEMLTGELPFRGDYEHAVMYSIINEEPAAITDLRADVPRRLAAIVGKLLAKEPGDRYQDAAEVSSDLRSVRVQLRRQPEEEERADKKPSIAVLPFVNMSPDKEQEYFCDGMAEELINGLTKLEGLQVVSRTSSFQFRGKDQDVRRIGEQLKVDTVLEGSVRKAGDRLRVTAQLVKTDDGYHLWSERYDRELEDIFDIQDEISLAIVEQLKLELLGEEKDDLVKHHTENVAAYDLYLEGRFHWNTRSKAGVNKAVGLFKRAVELDDSFALAYVGLADSYAIMGDNNYGPPSELFPKAREAALKALEIDDSLGEAYASLGLVAETYEMNHKGAGDALRKAIELKPNYATAHHWYAMHLAMGGRFAEALDEIEVARKLDPLSLPIQMGLGWILYGARRHDEAEGTFRKAAEAFPTSGAPLFGMAAVYADREEHRKSLEYAKQAFEMVDWDVAYTDSFTAIIYARMGETDKARKTLGYLISRREHTDINAGEIASICFALGDNDDGFEWLEKAFEEKDPHLRMMRVMHYQYPDPVESDPRFLAILKKMGLEG